MIDKKELNKQLENRINAKGVQFTNEPGVEKEVYSFIGPMEKRRYENCKNTNQTKKCGLI